MIEVLWQIAGVTFSAIVVLILLFALFILACAVGHAISAMMRDWKEDEK